MMLSGNWLNWSTYSESAKYWAQLMREFLFELFGQGTRGNDSIERTRTVSLRRSLPIIRSGTLRREWKLKCWVQALEGTAG